MRTVNVAKDFSRFPAGRYKRNGSTSGEAFRERHLEGPLSKGESVRVELDGTIGYGSSFLEEAFGGLVRRLNVDPDVLRSRLVLVSSDASLLAEILQYIEEARATH
jgi:hypothetical protein